MGLGQVYQINVKERKEGERGLPKRPVNSAKISTPGLEGDYNVYRHDILSGDLDSAVLFMPIEMLEQLNKEGWPVKPGDIGENITTIGISYESFSPGKKCLIGKVETVISRACEPCKNLYLLPYVGANKGPEFMKSLIGRRGWYARVIKEGIVEKGDAILVQD